MREPVPTVFLDRDGVINRRVPDDYVTCRSEFQVLPGSLNAIALLNRAGFRTVVVTNQRGIALGRMTRGDVDVIHRELSRLVQDSGGCLEEFYLCPHDRDAGCDCRKPMPGLLDRAHRFLPVAWPLSYLVGDSDSDILAGRARKLVTVKIGERSQVGANVTVPGLNEAVSWIIGYAQH